MATPADQPLSSIEEASVRELVSTASSTIPGALTIIRGLLASLDAERAANRELRRRLHGGPRLVGSCSPTPGSSRTCERGTRTCTIQHARLDPEGTAQGKTEIRGETSVDHWGYTSVNTTPIAHVDTETGKSTPFVDPPPLSTNPCTCAWRDDPSCTAIRHYYDKGAP